MSLQTLYQRVHGAAEHQQVYVMPSASSASDRNSDADVSSQVGRCLGYISSFSAAQHSPALPSFLLYGAMYCCIKHKIIGSLQCGAIQDGQAHSCRGMSEATAQSPSAYDRLAKLEAMVTGNTSPSSPDSHLRRCQQEYESVAAELSHGRDLCEEAAGTSGAASSSIIAPKWSIAASAATSRDSQVCASGSCFSHIRVHAQHMLLGQGTIAACIV